MPKVLIVDQFSGVSPYYLKQDPQKFDDLCKRVLNAEPSKIFLHRKPELKEVDDNFQPPFATTVLRADKNGNAEVWRANWDTSG